VSAASGPAASAVGLGLNGLCTAPEAIVPSHCQKTLSLGGATRPALGVDASANDGAAQNWRPAQEAPQ
jgi:hypothetical protein